MYDKVKIFCPRTGRTPDVSQFLEYCKEVIDTKTGEVTFDGGVGGLKVQSYPSGISILGSLPKFLHGDNLCPLNVHTTKEVTEKIADTLHLDLLDATLSEMEFGANMIMRKQVFVYLSKLGQMPRLERQQFTPDTLYYKSRDKRNDQSNNKDKDGKKKRIQQKKSLCFYDKGLEVGGAVLEKYGLGGANVLRYEMRLRGRLGQQLKVPKIFVPTLYERGFYRYLVGVWKGHYESIEKTRKTTNIMSKPMTVKNAFDVLVARLISQSDQALIADFIDELKANKVFPDRKDYTRLRQKLAKVSTLADFCTEDEDVVELDNEVRNATAYM